MSMKKNKRGRREIQPATTLDTPPLKTFKALHILKYMKPYAWLLVLALILSIIQITATLASPVVIGMAIDYMIGANNVNFEYILEYCVFLGIAIAVVLASQWLASICTNRLSYLVVRDLRSAQFEKLQKLPLAYLDSHPHGDLMSRVVIDTDQISDGLIQGFTQAFSGIVTIIGTLIFMLSINLTVTLVVVTITPISIILAWVLAKSVHKTFAIQARERGEMSGLAEELISGQKVVKAFNYEPAAEERFDKINKRIKKVSIKAMFFSAVTNPSTRFVNGIVYAAVCVIGAIMVINTPETLSIGLLSCFLTYANQYTKPFNEITGVITELQTATAAARRVLELLDEQEEPSDSGLPELEYCDGSVDAKGVNFGYTKDTTLITDFNLNVLPGNRVAIVGPTGCGKTTLINLLMRFYNVDSGEIMVSNQNINDVTRHSLRSKYGMVLQDTWLFDGTIRENIAYGKPDASLDEIISAAKEVHVDSFIKRLPDGYDTIISGNGAGISQGERQLICIARIMLTSPPMLILDEATSSIDTRTELKIQSAFAKMMRGRTSFIIAHRLSTIMDADLILVMNNGNIIESGTHSQLLEKKGFYYNLYNSQFESI